MITLICAGSPPSKHGNVEQSALGLLQRETIEKTLIAAHNRETDQLLNPGHSNQAETERGLREIDLALTVDAADPRLWWWRSKDLKRLGRIEESRESRKKAIHLVEHQPKFHDLLPVYYHQEASQSAEEGDIIKTADMFLKSFYIDPYTATDYDRYGEELARAGDKAKPTKDGIAVDRTWGPLARFFDRYKKPKSPRELERRIGFIHINMSYKDVVRSVGFPSSDCLERHGQPLADVCWRYDYDIDIVEENGNLIKFDSIPGPSEFHILIDQGKVVQIKKLSGETRDQIQDRPRQGQHHEVITFREIVAQNALAFSHDGKMLAQGGDDGTVKLRALPDYHEKTLLRGHRGDVRLLAFSPDSKTLVSAGDDGTVRLWSLLDGRERATIDLTPLHKNRNIDYKYYINDLEYSPNGRIIATSDSEGVTRLLEATNLRVKAILLGHFDSVNSVAFAPDGRTLATGSSDATIKIWDIATAREQDTLWGYLHAVKALAFTPDGKTLAAARQDGTVRLWDMPSRKERTIIKGSPHCTDLIAFSPNRAVLALAGGFSKVVVICDLNTGQHRNTIYEHENFITCICFSKDGGILASGSADRTVRLWNYSGRHVGARGGGVKPRD